MSPCQQCTQCGACLNTCPVFRHFKSEEYSPKAKQQLMQAALAEEHALDWDTMAELAGHCTSCGRCERACAVKLSVPERLATVRGRHPQWQQYAWREWIRHGNTLWPPARVLAPLMPQNLLPPKLAILHAAARAMQAPREYPQWLRLRAVADIRKGCGDVLPLNGKQVAIFAGCTASRLRPAWIKKVVHVVQHLGGTVLEHIPFHCCGGTYDHAGLHKAYQSAAAHNVALWKKHDKPLLAVFCASCVHSLRHYSKISTLFSQNDEYQNDAQLWTKSIRALAMLVDATYFEQRPEAPQSIHYHSPCHWEGRDVDLALLQSIFPQMRQGRALCCGFGGVLKLLNPCLSKDLADACWQGFGGADEQAVLTGCSGCVMQLSAHAPAKASVFHWLDVLSV